MSRFSSLLSASVLAITVAWGGVAAAAPEPPAASPAKPAAAKDSKAKDTKASSGKDAKSKDAAAKDTKSKDTKSKDAKADSKSKDAKSKDDGKGKSASKETGKDAKSKSTTGKTSDSKKDAKASASSAPKPNTARFQAPAVAAPAMSSGGSNISGGELGVLQQAVRAARSSRASEAMAAASQLSDPVAQKLVTWLVVRQSPNDLGFRAVNAFIKENPGWPTQGTLRRRAERVLFQENRDLNAAREFFSEQAPLSGEGKVAFARVLVASGNSKEAADWVRAAYRDDALNDRFESTILEEFGSAITRADHKLRADRFSYGENPDAERALRAAARAGSDVVALTKARMAIGRKEASGERLLAQVPFTLANDPAYLHAKSQLLRRADKPQEAARALLAGSASPSAAAGADEWWIERRLVARELLDAGDAQLAYKVAATGVPPEKDAYRAEQQWTSGWIALRFLKDPRTAAQHFAKVDDEQKHPITLARAYFWQARAAEAMGDGGRARSGYQAASRFPFTYYGQLSRVKLGMPAVTLPNASPSFSARNDFNRLEAVKALRMLYAIGDRDTAATIYYDLGARLDDAGQISMLADLAESAGDARGALAAGKEGLAEGHQVDNAAFPDFGLPSFNSIGYPVDKAVVYSIARQETQFNPTIVSRAKAMGFMQVTPEAGRHVSKLTGVPYDERRLMSDQTYNVQFGAAEIGELVQAFRGNYVLAFASYNGGRGNVAKWIQRYGDPRDPEVDVVDWVESIPFSETRNYVQRVMENYQVYKVRFNIPTKLQMEADLRGSTAR